MTISDNESAGSTAYAGSAVSASTSNNREEVVISSLPQVGEHSLYLNCGLSLQSSELHFVLLFPISKVFF